MLEHSDALIATQSPIIISIKFTMYKHFITGQFLKNGLHTIIPLKKIHQVRHRCLHAVCDIHITS